MSRQYELQAGEAVILKDARVKYGGLWDSHTDDLMLTSFNLVLTERGIFGNIKGVLVFPLNQIKIHDGRAQALHGVEFNGSSVLDIYFASSQERFGFRSGGSATVKMWAAKINEVVTGTPTVPEQDTPVNSSTQLLADVLHNSVSMFKAKLNLPETNSSGPQASGKCRGCGAPLVGIQGQMIKCDYCWSPQQLG